MPTTLALGGGAGGRSAAADWATAPAAAAALATRLDGFGGDAGIRRVARHHMLGQFPAQELLDVLEEALLIHADQGEGLALGAGPAGAADAVDVVLGDLGSS